MAFTLRLLGAAAGFGICGSVTLSEPEPASDPVVEQLQAQASKRNSETRLSDGNDMNGPAAAMLSREVVATVSKMHQFLESPERTQALTAEEVEHASKYKGVLYRVEVESLLEGAALRFKMDGGCTQRWGQVPVNCLYLLGTPLKVGLNLWGNSSTIFEEGDYMQYDSEVTMGQGLEYMEPKPHSVTCKACGPPGDNLCILSVDDFSTNITVPECGSQLITGGHTQMQLPVPHSKQEERVLTNTNGVGRLIIHKKDGTPVLRMTQYFYTGDIYKLSKMLQLPDMPVPKIVGELKERMRGGPDNEPYYTDFDTAHISSEEGQRRISEKGAAPTVPA